MLPFQPAEIRRVAFYKRDELTTDLICCEVTAQDGRVHAAHEEHPGWSDLLRCLSGLPAFDGEWFSKVAQPPFAACAYVAYSAS